ncbi:hypothetical protein GQ53DRAFT_473107 [Thozetella sp. PMI_491]|nr:hypothetical protein GQ53DRAFT_473107 [Thozetella sp. PMI_491]
MVWERREARLGALCSWVQCSEVPPQPPREQPQARFHAPGIRIAGVISAGRPDGHRGLLSTVSAGCHVSGQFHHIACPGNPLRGRPLVCVLRIVQTLANGPSASRLRLDCLFLPWRPPRTNSKYDLIRRGLTTACKQSASPGGYVRDRSTSQKATQLRLHERAQSVITCGHICHVPADRRQGSKQVGRRRSMQTWAAGLSSRIDRAKRRCAPKDAIAAVTAGVTAWQARVFAAR